MDTFIMAPEPFFASRAQLPPSALQAQAMALVADAQAAAAAFYALGALGALVPELLAPALAPATVYGRQLAAAKEEEEEGAAAAAAEGTPPPPPPSPLLRLSRALSRVLPVPKGAAFTFFYLAANGVNALALLLARRAGQPAWALALLALFQLHALRRLGECLTLHRFSRGARMPAALALAGALHYAFASFALLPARPREWRPYAWRGAEAEEAAVEAALGGAGGAGRALDALVAALGLALFVGGSVAQHAAHRQLAALRGGGCKRAGEGEEEGEAEDEGEGADGREGERERKREHEREGEGEGEGEREAEAAAGGAARAGGAEGVLRSRRDGSGLGAGAAPPAAAAGASRPLSRPLARPRSAVAAAYPFPRGGLFAVSLSPHYTAEIAIYCGLLLLRGALASLEEDARALQAGRDATGAPLLSAAPRREPAGAAARAAAPLLLAFVCCNLGVTALRAKRWYCRAYPAERAARETAAVLPLLL